jgi:beta-glucosidase
MSNLKNICKVSARVALLICAIVFMQCSSAPTEKSTAREKFIDSLLGKMTFKEKIGQLTLYTSGWAVTGPTMKEDYLNDIRKGYCGNVFNAHGVKYSAALQKIAVEETRLGIPLLFGLDVIHGFKTIYPIPLAEACSWDLKLIEETARLSALEATASGISWNYNPMVDIARDPRWGRIAEGSGEDTYLSSLIAAAKVSGYQGKNLKASSTMAACVKHFAAYGAPQGGRDYNTVDISDRTLRETYLPPFKAAVDAGVRSVMTAFNELNGVPSSANKYLLKDILRGEFGFKGLVVTDYTSIGELVKHGYAKNEKEAARLAITSGVDMDMQSGAYFNFMRELVDENKVHIKTIEESVRHVLELKYDLGLFEDPYRYLDTVREQENTYSEEMMRHALESAKRSIVLLKNDTFQGQKLLPVRKTKQRIALIGPLGNNNLDVMGTWHSSGNQDKVVPVLEGLKKKFSGADIACARGCDFESKDKTGFPEALKLAKSSDIVILAVGENYMQSGEAASRTNINLPGVQEDLVKEIVATGKPVIALIMAGRPLTIEWIDGHVPAILYAWHLGSRTGDAVADVISGDYNPSAKLVVTFPRNVGQVPIYYNMKNTGRPLGVDAKFASKYIDSPNDPLYPFGYGLSYTSFNYSKIHLNETTISTSDTLVVSVTVKNTGKVNGEEIVQLYIRDLVASVTRPVKELKGFKKIALNPGESKEVEFKITAGDLKFYDINMNYLAEPGDFKVFVGTHSECLQETDFSLVSN